MRQRGLVVAVAFLLAIGATAAVFMYVQGVRDEARTGGALKTVIVPTQDITAGTDLNPLIDQGAFRELSVPEDAVVEGAVTSLSELRDKTTTAAILTDEQIPVARLSGGELPGGAIGIPKGMVAVTVALDGPQGGGGVVQRGDHVTLYATFESVQVNTTASSIQAIVHAAQSAASTKQDIGDFTVTLVPDVQVLSVNNPSVESGTTSTGIVILTLALTPQDAQAVVFAQEKGKVWTALLPPGQAGVAEPPTTVLPLILGKK